MSEGNKGIIKKIKKSCERYPFCFLPVHFSVDINYACVRVYVRVCMCVFVCVC